MDKKIENKNMYKCSKCGQELWRFLDEDTIHLLGFSGECIINFNSVEIICSGCKKKNYITSSIAKDIKKMFEDRVKKNDKKAIVYIRKKSLLSIPYSNLTASEQSRVSKDLSVKQKNILNYLMSEENASINKIMQEFKLNERTVINDVDKITNEIVKIKKSFKQYYKAPCYSPDIRKKQRLNS